MTKTDTVDAKSLELNTKMADKRAISSVRNDVRVGINTRSDLLKFNTKPAIAAALANGAVIERDEYSSCQSSR
ncbi:MAG: hypothetical protein AB1489_32845 [Acidobacteriota bacterium]